MALVAILTAAATSLGLVKAPAPLVPAQPDPVSSTPSPGGSGPSAGDPPVPASLPDPPRSLPPAAESLFYRGEASPSQPESGSRRQPGSAVPPHQVVPGSVLACIRRWESLTSGLYHAVSLGGRYRGAYQFDWKTWLGVGGSGDPALATPAEQDYRAGLLVRLRGLAPWPTPARRCA
jgi:hypothetical protein